MDFFYFKALHIIFVITWFAGLFYIVRLFVYHAEAEQKEEVEKKILQKQYKLMERRLWYGIAWPSMILANVFGIWMIVLSSYYLRSSWFILKLAFVLGLILYHIRCQKIFNDLQKDIVKVTSFKMRLWNEVATLFLVAIVFIIVLKDTYSFIYGLGGLVLLALILMFAIKRYKKIREKKEEVR